MPAPGLFIKVALSAQQFFLGTQRVRGALNLLSSAFRAVFRTAIVAGFFLILRSIYQTISSTVNIVKQLGAEFAELNLAGMRTAAVFARGGANTASVFDAVTKKARDLSTQVSYTAKEIQEGFYTAAIAGFNLADSFTVAGSAMQLATVGQTDFKQTINDLIGIVNAFGISMDKLPRIANTIAAAFNNSKMELQDFFNAMKYVSAAANAIFGESEQTFNDVSAALMTLQDAGLGASQAGVYLRGSLLKLQGSTSKVLNVFAKYGVDILENTAQSKKYFQTLVSGRAALSDYYDKLVDLKQAQSNLVISGRENSNEFKNISAQIDKTQQSISTLESGMDTVFQQFEEAGGKLKPLSEVIATLAKTVPIEVIGKAFGIRGGVGIQLLLGKINLYEKHKTQLKEANKLYDEGQSILANIFSKVIDTFLVKWLMLGNTLKNTFSVIYDSFANAASPVLDSLLKGFRNVYQFIERNKRLFTNIFKDIAYGIKPIIDSFSQSLMQVVGGLHNIVGRASFKLPLFGVNKEGAVAITGEQKVEGGATPLKKLSAFVVSLGSLITAYLKVLLKELTPIMEFLATTFFTIVKFQFEKNIMLFTTIGKILFKGALEELEANKTKIFNVFQEGASKFLEFFKSHESEVIAIGTLIAEAFLKAIGGVAMGLLKERGTQLAAVGITGNPLAGATTDVGIDTRLLGSPVPTWTSLLDKLINIIITDRKDLKNELNGAIGKLERSIHENSPILS